MALSWKKKGNLVVVGGRRFWPINTEKEDRKESFKSEFEKKFGHENLFLQERPDLIRGIRCLKMPQKAQFLLPSESFSSIVNSSSFSLLKGL